MLGAIIGDIVGSVYEWNNIKTKEFPLAAITGSIAEAYYGIPEDIKDKALSYLDKRLSIFTQDLQILLVCKHSVSQRSISLH